MCNRDGEPFLLNGLQMRFYCGKKIGRRFNKSVVDTPKIRSSLLTTPNFPTVVAESL